MRCGARFLPPPTISGSTALRVAPRTVLIFPSSPFGKSRKRWRPHIGLATPPRKTLVEQKRFHQGRLFGAALFLSSVRRARFDRAPARRGRGRPAASPVVA